MNIGKLGRGETRKNPNFLFRWRGPLVTIFDRVGLGAVGGGIPDMGMGFQTRGGVPDMGWGSRHGDGVPVRDGVPDMRMGFQTWRWGSRQGMGFLTQRWGSKQGVRFQTWGWGCKDGDGGVSVRDGVPDMGMEFQTWR